MLEVIRAQLTQPALIRRGESPPITYDRKDRNDSNSTIVTTQIRDRDRTNHIGIECYIMLIQVIGIMLLDEKGFSLRSFSSPRKTIKNTILFFLFRHNISMCSCIYKYFNRRN